MDLGKREFEVEYAGETFRGVIKGASGAERESFLAEESRISDEHEKVTARAAALRRFRNGICCEYLLSLPDSATIEDRTLPPTGDPFRIEWIDFLPDVFVMTATFARFGLLRDLGNSKPTPEES